MKKFYNGRIGLISKVTYKTLFGSLRTKESYTGFACNIKAVDEEDGIRQMQEWGEKLKTAGTGRFAWWNQEKHQKNDKTVQDWNNVISIIWEDARDQIHFVKDWLPFDVEIIEIQPPKLYQLSHEETIKNFTTEDIFGDA